MTISKDPKPEYRTEIIVVLGYVLFMLLAVGICGGAFYLAIPQPQAPRSPIVAHLHGPTPQTPTSPAPTTPDPIIAALLAPTPTAYIPVGYQPGTHSIFKDDFTDNHNRWYNTVSFIKITVKDGTLSFASPRRGSYALVVTGQAQYLDQPSYIQADLSTDSPVDQDFGMIFADQSNEFFLFAINTEAKEYSLFRNLGGIWSLRLLGTSDLIHLSPTANTLGLYVNKGYLELYINHKRVDVFQESSGSFQAGQVGFYVNDSGFQLRVTDFSVDTTGGQ